MMICLPLACEPGNARLARIFSRLVQKKLSRNMKAVFQPLAAVREGEVQFLNRRAELYHALRERYRTGEIRHAGLWPKLAAQLTGLSYRFTSRGQWQIETKDELRARRLPSPDWADAVALCFAPERPALLLRPVGLCSVRAVETPLPRL